MAVPPIGPRGSSGWGSTLSNQNSIRRDGSQPFPSLQPFPQSTSRSVSRPPIYPTPMNALASTSQLQQSRRDDPPHLPPTGSRSFSNRRFREVEDESSSQKKSKTYGYEKHNPGSTITPWADNNQGGYEGRYRNAGRKKGKGREETGPPLFHPSQSPAPFPYSSSNSTSIIPRVNSAPVPPVKQPALKPKSDLIRIENASTGLLSDGRYLRLLGTERSTKKATFDWTVLLPAGEDSKRKKDDCFLKIKDIGGDLIRNGPSPPVAPSKESAGHYFVYTLLVGRRPTLLIAESVRNFTPATAQAPANNAYFPPPVIFDSDSNICALVSDIRLTDGSMTCCYSLPTHCAGIETPAVLGSRRAFKLIVDLELLKSGWEPKSDGFVLRNNGTEFVLYIRRIANTVVPEDNSVPAVLPDEPIPPPIQPGPTPNLPPVKMEIDAPSIETPIAGPSQSTTTREPKEMVKRIVLPTSCRDVNSSAYEAFERKEMRSAHELGQIILSRSVEGDSLLIHYILYEKEVEVGMDIDVKPIIPPSPNARAIPRVVAPPVIAVVRNSATFPDGMRESSSKSFNPSGDHGAIEKSVKRFLNLYLDDFDSSRAALERYYAPNASFSSRCINTLPARLEFSRLPRTAFGLQYSITRNRTPTSIMNAIKALPAGQTLTVDAVLDSQELPDPSIGDSNRPRVLFINLQGSFAEFQGPKRSFSRSFLLLPAGKNGRLEWMILVDNIIWRHFLPLIQTIPVGVRITPRVIDLPINRNAAPPIVVAAAARVVTPVAAKVIAPEEEMNESGDESDDCFIVDEAVASPVIPIAVAVVPPPAVTPVKVPIEPVVDPKYEKLEARTRRLEALLEEINKGKEIEANRRDALPAPPPESDEEPQPTPKLKKKKIRETKPVEVPVVVAPKVPKRIVKIGNSSFVSHGKGGKSNKIRNFFRGNDGNHFAFTNLGDIVEWKQGVGGRHSQVTTLSTAVDNGDRVDKGDCLNGVLVMGFLGKEKKIGPISQAVIYDTTQGSNAIVKPFNTNFPHGTNGVTAISHLPASNTSGTRFITAGSDKKIFLWKSMTENPTTVTATTMELDITRTSTITDLMWEPSKNWIISVGYDKKVSAFDLDRSAMNQSGTVWDKSLDALIHSTTIIPHRPGCTLLGTAATANQFKVVDFRLNPKDSIPLEFGFTLPAKASGKHVGESAALGRFFTGGFNSTGNNWIFPDCAEGFVIFDIRKVNKPAQVVVGVGRSKVFEVAFAEGDNQLVLSTASDFGTIDIL